jgi:hypothetical protein
VPDVPPDDLYDIKRWYFAVGGVDTQQDAMELGGPITLRRVKEFPTDERLALSLTRLPIAGAMALYGGKVIGHELVIDAERFEDKTELIFPTAQAILAGFRIRTRAEIICPAVCERSWADLRANPPNQCRAFHFERGVSHQMSGEPKKLLHDDLEWVRNNLGTVVRLTDNERFHTAVEALCTYMLAANDRMKVAQLWAGVEAIFDVQYELQYRLSTLTARLLAEPGSKCRELYKEMKSLYGERSKIVHGKKVSEEKIRTHITTVRGRLADILTRLIELGKVPTGEDFEEMLFEK